MSDLKQLEEEVNCGDTLLFLTSLRACEKSFGSGWKTMSNIDQVNSIITFIEGYRAGKKAN